MKEFLCKNFSNFLTVTEISNLLFISKKTVYRMISEKKLISYKFGGVYLIEKSSLESLIKED